MDIEHCLTVRMDVELARFEQAADKTLTQRLLYICLSPAFRPSGFGTNNGAKLIFFLQYHDHLLKKIRSPEILVFCINHYNKIIITFAKKISR